MNVYKLLYINIFLSLFFTIIIISILESLNPSILIPIMFMPFLITYILIKKQYIDIQKSFKINKDTKDEDTEETQEERIFTQEERTFDSYEDYISSEEKTNLVNKNDRINNLCNILNIGSIENLNIKLLKKNYRKLAKKYHPDLVQDKYLKESYKDSMSILNNAYSELKEYLNKP